MALSTYTPTAKQYYQDGSIRTSSTAMYAGRTGSGTLYYTRVTFDLSGSDIATKSIKSAKYYITTASGGNNTTLPAGCGASKTQSYAECQAKCNNPTATANITVTASTEWTFDLTADAEVFKAVSTPTYVYMGPRDTTGSTYKVFSATSPRLEIETVDGAMYYFTGTAWQACEVYRYNGTSWEQCVPSYYDGSGWKECGV